ncbi:hypothetical protein AYK24_09650 [Thermoplasmatales archaeon SG8-52-4]|nr:MAG: hypothetical protein AYK24_09650 [Thermoplasmatales archaeon SG8-52-4]
MFENRSEKELIFIYVLIALIVTCGLAVFHYSQGFWDPYVLVIIANIEFFCIFYILYLPLKVKRARERQEKTKNSNKKTTKK